MRSKFSLAYQQEHDAKGEIEQNVKIDVYMDCLEEDALDYFKQGLITMCNSMSDYFINDISGRD